MTHKEKLIISAYTGFLMVEFSELHEYIEKIMERPVYTHELAGTQLHEELQTKLKADFMKLCNSGKGTNLTEMNPVDEFICSICGFHCEDMNNIVYDEEDEDFSYYEYEIEFCPHCGAEIRGVK